MKSGWTSVCAAAVSYTHLDVYKRQPLTTKRLTVDGDAIGEAKNVEVVIGTPIGDVLDFCGCLLYTSRCV